jgi:hypothetical protein
MQGNEKKPVIVVGSSNQDRQGIVSEGFVKSLPTYARKAYHLIGPPTPTLKRRWPKVGRNEPCPCGKKDGDGKPIKFKKCCIGKDLSRFIKKT